MSPFERYAASAFEQTVELGAESSPTELLSALATIPSPFAALNDPMSSELLGTALSISAGQAAMVAREQAARGEPPSSLIVDLFRWLINTLKTWNVDEDHQRRTLVAILMTMACFDTRMNIYQHLSSHLGSNKKLSIELAAELASFQIQYTPFDTPGLPIWEREFAEKFIKVDEAGDWVQIATMWPRLESANRPSLVIGPIVRLLACMDFLALTFAVENYSQIAIAAQVVSLLSSRQSLDLAIHTNNHYIQYAATLLSPHLRQGSMQILEEEQEKIYRILVRVASDFLRWSKWMRVINRHPPHYQYLQTSLGRALANIDSEGRSSYIDSMEMAQCQSLDEPSRQTVTECMTSFRLNASAQAQSELWKAAYSRWSAWRFGVDESETTQTKICWSNLDYAVTCHALFDMSSTERSDIIQNLMRKMNDLTEQWYVSVTHCSAEWYRILSELQPFARADAVANGDHPLDISNRLYVPGGVKDSRYLELKFGSIRELSATSSSATTTLT